MALEESWSNLSISSYLGVTWWKLVSNSSCSFLTSSLLLGNKCLHTFHDGVEVGVNIVVTLATAVTEQRAAATSAACGRPDDKFQSRFLTQELYDDNMIKNSEVKIILFSYYLEMKPVPKAKVS